jgi:hypothetical protein
MVDRSTRTLVATGTLGALIMVLAAWAAFVALVGSYFGFGLDTDEAWSFNRLHWILSVAPGIVAFAGGMMLLVPLRTPAWLGAFLALLGGLWLVIGPSSYPLVSSGGVDLLPASEAKTALRWTGYFYGSGALIVLLAGIAQGLLTRRPPEFVREEPHVPSADERIPSRPRVLSYP